MDEEIRVNDLVVATEVVQTIVRLAAEKVEGVAAVGQPTDLNGLFSFFSQKKADVAVPAVTVKTVDAKLDVTVRLSVLFGYPFTTLAQDVRNAVATSLSSQVGVEVQAVNVYIDSLLFPKE